MTQSSGPRQSSSAHLQGRMFHSLSEQPVPVPFPDSIHSHNENFFSYLQQEFLLLQVISVASYSLQAYL